MLSRQPCPRPSLAKSTPRTWVDTPRKSFAQLLNAAGVDKQQMADIGGWKLQDRGPAMEGYCHTTPRMHLTVKASLPGPSY